MNQIIFFLHLDRTHDHDSSRGSGGLSRQKEDDKRTRMMEEGTVVALAGGNINETAKAEDQYNPNTYNDFSPPLKKGQQRTRSSSRLVQQGIVTTLDSFIECSICRIPRPPSAHHCFKCGVCINQVWIISSIKNIKHQLTLKIA